MKWPAGICLTLMLWPAFVRAGDPSVTVDGVSYSDIQDAHVVGGGKVAVLYPGGGVTLAADKLPKAFLKSWDITPERIAAVKSESEKTAEQALAKAIQAGYFREVGGVVYDLRKVQSGWRRFQDAKILQVTDDGALVDPSPGQGLPAVIFVRNLPHRYADNDRATFTALPAGEFSYVNKFGYAHTIHSYDLGRVCRRNEIPEAVLHNGAAYAALPEGSRPNEEERPRRAGRIDRELRGIGSGFFVTKDGYFLTNYHVVREASRLEVQTKAGAKPAEVVQVDKVNDLALLKIAGGNFTPLAVSSKDSDLGDAVFTIGFPNIDMQGTAPKYTDGKISSTAGMQDDPTEYQISVPVQPGNSGGPLCDANGDVVGLVVARLNDMAALRESGAVPQNVNYAVKSKYALRLLQNIKGAGVLPAGGSKPASPVHLVEDAIGMVRVY